MVTTYDAGMSVPDWPGTYGYNLFLYPPSTWLFGPFDILVEHGHRLLASVVGLVSIALMVAAWLRENRLWVILLCFGVLLLVIGQGVLGGLRVVLSDYTLAMLHGCVGPAFFALCAGTSVVTSRWWFGELDAWDSQTATKPGRWLAGVVVTVVVLSYVQLVLGAQLRHAQPTTTAGIFAMLTSIHILTAFLLWGLTVVGWAMLRRCGDLTLSRPAASLIGLVFVQISLGTGTWIVNYGYPTFLRWAPGATSYLVQAKGFLESLIVTGHVATGSLILAVGVFLLVRVLRRRHQASEAWLETPEEELVPYPAPAMSLV